MSSKPFIAVFLYYHTYVICKYGAIHLNVSDLIVVIDLVHWILYFQVVSMSEAFMVDITHIICCHTLGSWVKCGILEEHDASIFRMIELGEGGHWVIVCLGHITTDGQSGQTFLRAYDWSNFSIQFLTALNVLSGSTWVGEGNGVILLEGRENCDQSILQREQGMSHSLRN